MEKTGSSMSVRLTTRLVVGFWFGAVACAGRRAAALGRHRLYGAPAVFVLLVGLVILK